MGNIQKHLPHCLNCGNELSPTDQFCSYCGQRTRGEKVPLVDFINDFFQDYFAVDAKFFRSIFLLMVKPGKLTKLINKGKRKSYIAPLRMYLFTSFIYFFLLSLTVKQSNLEFGRVGDDINDQKALILDSLLSSGTDTIAIANLQSRVDSIQEEEISGSTISLDGGEYQGGFWDYTQEQLQKVNDNPESLIQSLLRVASVALFFLLPVFAWVLKVFHFRRNSFYVQHLVHAFHLHTFGFALLSIYLLVGFWVESETFGIILLLLLVYFIASLKVVYEQKVFPSIFKAFSILLVYFILVLAAVVPAILVAIATV